MSNPITQVSWSVLLDTPLTPKAHQSALMNSVKKHTTLTGTYSSITVNNVISKNNLGNMCAVDLTDLSSDRQRRKVRQKTY